MNMETKRCKGDCRKVLPIESFDRYELRSSKRRIRCKACEAIHQAEKAILSSRQTVRKTKTGKDFRYVTGDFIYC